MSDEKHLPRPRPVEVREFVETPSPWSPVKDVVTNLVLVFGGGAVFWFVTDRIEAPFWVALVTCAAVWVAGTAIARLSLSRRRRSAPARADE